MNPCPPKLNNTFIKKITTNKIITTRITVLNGSAIGNCPNPHVTTQKISPATTNCKSRVPTPLALTVHAAIVIKEFISPFSPPFPLSSIPFFLYSTHSHHLFGPSRVSFL